MAAEIDFGSVIKRSKDLVFKNRWLWVYGLVVATLTGSGGSGFGNGFSTSDSKSGKIPPEAQKMVQEVGKAVTDWVATIPAHAWILFGIGLLILIVLGIIVQWVTISWAKGALIGGLEEADKGEIVTLQNTTHFGIKSLKKLIIFNIITSLISLGTIIALLVVYGLVSLVLSFIQPLMILWMVMSGLLGLLGLIIFLVVLAMVAIYAERLVVLKDFSPWEAWKKCLAISRGNFLNTVLMGLLNSGIGCGVGCVTSLVITTVLAIPAVILAIPLFAKNVFWPSIVGLIFLLLVWVTANSLVRAGLVVFNFSNWNQIFKKVYDKE